MNFKSLFTVIAILGIMPFLYGQSSDHVQIFIEWEKRNVRGSIAVTNGDINYIKVVKGEGEADGDNFNITSEKYCRLEINIKNAKLQYGPGATIVHITAEDYPFSFFLRDVKKQEPIYIPSYAVVVLEGDDDRSYNSVQNDILSEKRLTKIDLINRRPETSFSSVQDKVRDMSVPIWLGLSRDMRIFDISEELEDTG